MLRKLEHFLRTLKLPWLFLLSALAMLVSWLIPDPVPLLDELLLLLTTTLLGSLRNVGKSDRPDPANTQE